MPDSWTSIVERLTNARHGSGAAAAQIQRAGEQLDVTWPGAFKKFLAEVGYLQSTELTVYGLGPKVPKELGLVKNVQGERKVWSEIAPLPETLVPISPDGRGGHYCLNVAKAKDGDCPVVYWDHELVEPGYKGERHSTSFTAFLKSHVPPKPKAKPRSKAKAKQAAAPADPITALRKGTKSALELAGPQSAGSLAAAEKSLGVKCPELYRRLLREIGVFEYISGWRILGVDLELEPDEQLVARTGAFWELVPGARGRYLPIAESVTEELACVDLAAEPASVVVFDTTASQSPQKTAMELDRFLALMPDQADPWCPE